MSETAPEDEYEKLLLDFLKDCSIDCCSLYELENLHIPREILVNNETYEKVKKYIPMFKKKLSSSYLTSLQSSATNLQRWPLLNLVRQILKTYNFRLNPKRLANGYSKIGKKLYRRVFHVVKLNQLPQ